MVFLDADDNLSADILNMAREYGADLAGLVDIESLKVSPSHRIYHKLPIYSLTENPNDGTTLENEKKSEGEINWPQGAETILIIAIRHPEDMPNIRNFLPIDVLHQNFYLEFHTKDDDHEGENEKIFVNYLFEFCFSRKLKHLF